MRQRVAITGIGTVSPYGVGVPTLMEGLLAEHCALSLIPDNMKISDVDCHIAGFVPSISTRIPRETRRGMSPMSVYAYLAAKEALAQAGLENEKSIGVCVGSTLGSGIEIASIFNELHQKGHLNRVRSMSFFKIMGHTLASNVALSLGLSGRVISPTAACATGLQAIGMAYETIAFGREKRMLCGGSEEFSFLATATFDKIGAASQALDPNIASLPFDKRRQGVVCSEGSGILCLEEMETAKQRGAEILGEIKGFATHISTDIAMLSPDSALRSMHAAITDASMSVNEIGYVNTHATGTIGGDIAEGQAIEQLFGHKVPVSSLKGYMGHPLAASGAIEAIVCVEMLKTNTLVGMRQDFSNDPACGDIQFAQTRDMLKKPCILKNSFALGGIYTSIVISKEQN